MSFEKKIQKFPVLVFSDSVLRGIGQVMLQNSSIAGLIFLSGIFYNSILLGLAALLGTTVSTATAMVLSADRNSVKEGLFGFNGTLVGIALLYFLEPSLLTWGYVVLGAACSTLFMAALLHLLGTWKIPALTAPFLFITHFFLLASSSFLHLNSTAVMPVAGLPGGGTIEGVVTTSTLAEGLLTGIAQVFFQDNIITGAIFLIGLLVSSRSAFTAALLGSSGGLLIAWGMGAAEPLIRSGTFGFNSVLTAIALGSGLFLLQNVASAAYAALAVVMTVVVFAGISAALEPLGMPALTSAFVLVVWVFLLASPLFARLHVSKIDNDS